MYSSPAARTVAGSSKGRGSIGSRLSTTTSPPAALNDLICCSVGWPPVIHPETGSARLGGTARADGEADTKEATHPESPAVFRQRDCAGSCPARRLTRRDRRTRDVRGD